MVVLGLISSKFLVKTHEKYKESPFFCFLITFCISLEFVYKKIPKERGEIFKDKRRIPEAIG